MYQIVTWDGITLDVYTYGSQVKALLAVDRLRGTFTVAGPVWRETLLTKQEAGKLLQGILPEGAMSQ